MPITAADLAKLTPFVKASPVIKTEVDLLKVAAALVAATDLLVNGEGEPTEKIEAFGDRVDEIDALLEKAIEDEDGNVYLEGSEDVAKTAEFAPDAADTGGAIDDGSSPADGDEIDVTKSLNPLEFTDDGMDDALEDGEWPEDLSPKNSPVMRNARLTKGERPVPARPGARGRVKKRYADARDEAFGRGDASSRCME